MQTNDFENQMKLKMEELKIHPPASIWQTVEAEIGKTRRRKRAWVFFPLLFLLVLGGGYLFLQPAITSRQNTDQTYLDEKNLKKEDHIGTRPHTLKEVAIMPVKPDKQKIALTLKHSVYKNLAPADISANHLPTPSLHTDDSRNSALHPEKPAEAGGFEVTKAPLVKVEELAADKEQISGPGTGTLNTGYINDTASGQAPGDTFKQADKIIKDLTDPSKSLVTNSNRRIKTWKFGVHFSAGVSGVPKGFLGSLEKSYSSADALYSSVPPQNNSAALPSRIRSAGALIAGLFVEKDISKNTTLTAGINYKWFASTNSVGIRSEISGRNNYSLSNAVNDYRNHYHFLELPVALKVRLTPKPFPVSWEGGVSVSQLLSSNALQFDNIRVLYYQKNALFNSTQFGFNTGFSATLFSTKKTSLLLGPYLYYGTTTIAAEGLYKNQHFTFIGLRSQILLNK